MGICSISVWNCPDRVGVFFYINVWNCSDRVRVFVLLVFGTVPTEGGETVPNTNRKNTPTVGTVPNTKRKKYPHSVGTVCK
jgi:hypothetical protein